MAYEIKRDEDTGLFKVIDTDTGKTLGRGEQPQAAINVAVERGMPAENKQALLVEAKQVVDKENSTQPEPPATASQSAQDDAPKGPNAPETAQVNANGRIVPPPDTTAPTNADETTTSENNSDRGLDDTTRTTEQTQATYYENDGTSSSTSALPETYYENDGSASTSAATEPGTPTNDDAANTSRTTTTTTANEAQANPIQITPQPNILDRYNNYAW